MRKILLPLFLVASSLLQAQQVIHDRDAEPREIGDFHSINVSGAVDIRLSQGDNAVAVSASSPESRANIRTEVRNGVLRIWYENKKWFKGGGGKQTAYVSVKAIRKIEASGASNVTVSGELNTQELAIELNGASDFKGTVKANSMTIALSGASDITIKGQVANINIEASGASHFKGYDLQADNCRAESSGASDIRITINKVINAEASGASSVEYRGEGQAGQVKTSGASHVSKK